MSFTINIWAIVLLLSSLIIFILSAILTFKKASQENNSFPFYISIEVLVFFFVMVLLSICLARYPSMTGDLIPYKASTISVKDYNDKTVYKDFKEVNNCINNGYNNKFGILNLDNNYDYLTIELTCRPISFSELRNYISSHDNNLIYNVESKLHKVTKPLILEGVLKTEIKEGIPLYLIGGYTLSKDEQGSISSLANNQKVILNIIYNEELNKDKKNITHYRILKAETN